MFFVLRKIAAAVLMPLPLILVAGFLGAWLWSRASTARRRGGGEGFGRSGRVGRALTALALAALWLASCSPVAELLVGPLEQHYPAFPGDSVDYVVVLGSGHVSAPGIPLSAVPSTASLYRLTEGLRIVQAQPWSTLVTSAYGGDDPRSNAEVNRELALALGLDAGRIVAEPTGRTTSGEARVLAPLLADRPFALVTSASHMRRAVDLFQREGLDPVPAPTAHRVKERPGWSWWALVPSISALEATTAGWYELLARVPMALEE